LKISAKGRYALCSMMYLSGQYKTGEYVTVISISEKLGISKIYLEQVFSLLKRGGLVSSVKGAQGGYRLTRTPEHIFAGEVLSAVELSLFEKPDSTVQEKAPEYDAAMQLLLFAPLNEAVKNTLAKVTLSDLVQESEKNKGNESYMFFI